MWRWKELSLREKEVAIRYVTEPLKKEVIASEMGISKTRFAQLVTSVYRILEVQDRVELALLIGKNWSRVKKDILNASLKL